MLFYIYEYIFNTHELVYVDLHEYLIYKTKKK